MTFDGAELVSKGRLPRVFDELTLPTQDVLQRLSDTTKCQPAENDFLTYDTFAGAFRKWRKSTSTSPSG